jgi:hypothetical protein
MFTTCIESVKSRQKKKKVEFPRSYKASYLTPFIIRPGKKSLYILPYNIITATHVERE